MKMPPAPDYDICKSICYKEDAAKVEKDDQGQYLRVGMNEDAIILKEYREAFRKEAVMEWGGEIPLLREAKMLLHSSSRTIKEVSYELGFDDPTYFSTFLKRNVKLSPAKYKVKPV